MKEQQWICVKQKYGRQKSDNYNQGTLSYTRKEAIEKLTGGTTIKWSDAKKKHGWQCIKVLVTIEPINPLNK